MIDTQPIVTELRHQREQLTLAIQALEQFHQPIVRQERPLQQHASHERKPRRRLSAAARARISKAMKAAWKKRR